MEDQLGRNGVELIPSEARFENGHTLVVTAGGSSRTMASKNILIAVGTRPASPSRMGLDGDAVITSDGVMKMKQLPRTMMVVGGGVTSIEYASIFSAFGAAVTLAER